MAGNQIMPFCSVVRHHMVMLNFHQGWAGWCKWLHLAILGLNGDDGEGWGDRRREAGVVLGRRRRCIRHVVKCTV